MTFVAERTINLGKAIRTARGTMTQGDLAQALGTDQPVISKWERGERRPSLEELHAIEQATGRRRGFILITAGCVDDVVTVNDAIDVAPIKDHAKTYLKSMYEQALREG